MDEPCRQCGGSKRLTTVWPSGAVSEVPCPRCDPPGYEAQPVPPAVPPAARIVTRRQVALAFAALTPGLLYGSLRVVLEYRDERERARQREALREEQTLAAEADLITVRGSLRAVPRAEGIDALVVPRTGDGRPTVQVTGFTSDQAIVDQVRERVQQTKVRTPVSFQIRTPLRSRDNPR